MFVQRAASSKFTSGGWWLQVGLSTGEVLGAAGAIQRTGKVCFQLFAGGCLESNCQIQVSVLPDACQ